MAGVYQCFTYTGPGLVNTCFHRSLAVRGAMLHRHQAHVLAAKFMALLNQFVIINFVNFTSLAT